MCDKTDFKAIDKAIDKAMGMETTDKAVDMEASQCVCDMEWRGIKVEQDSDDCRCML